MLRPIDEVFSIVRCHEFVVDWWDVISHIMTRLMYSNIINAYYFGGITSYVVNDMANTIHCHVDVVGGILLLTQYM